MNRISTNNMKIHKKIKKFFKKEIWIRPGILYSSLRIFLSSINFIYNKGFDKASTLTFYTLLSIVPIFAIAFGIAQSLGFANTLTEQVKIYFSSQPQVAEKLIEFSESTLKTTRGGLIASLGLLFLFWTAVNTIGNIERFLNEVWDLKNERTLFQKMKSFLPLVFLFPLLIVGPSSAIAFTSDITQNIAYIGPLLKTVLSFASYFVNWCVISFLYIYLPDTKVSWKAAFLAAFITVIIFAIWQLIYVIFQVKVGSYGVIYGSFAAVPLFLIWLNYSWLIIIFGARLCREIQKENEKSVNISTSETDNHSDFPN